MAKIAFVLLCHKDPEAIVKQAERLTAAGDYMAIHFDGRAPNDAYETLTAALGDNPYVVFAERRVKCGWGEWSLVEATLLAAKAALEAFPEVTHFYLLSGDCMPIKPAEYIHEFLDDRDKDFIESFDFFDSDWIKTGMKGDRLAYRHIFNERKSKWWFYTSLDLQRRLGLKRHCPEDVQVMIGSQWCCLRRTTVEKIFDFIEARPDVMRFFRYTWIPDEIFLQTLVRHLVPEPEIESRTLTFLMFSDYGMPVTFYNDHFDLLLSQDFLFARKISPEATELKRRLGKLYNTRGLEIDISGEGRRIYQFLSGRGRIGRRFAPRFWETESSVGRERQLYIVTCKKWHVAKRFIREIHELADLPVVEYLFDEENAGLPELGGIQNSLGKRMRHRRALIRMLFEYYDTQKLMICLDPRNLALIEDFFRDQSKTRLLEIECEFTDDYLLGHARRVGLAGESTPEETLRKLLPTVRSDVLHERDRIRDAQFPNHFRVSEMARPEENARTLAEFLGIAEEKVVDVTRTAHLFAE